MINTPQPSKTLSTLEKTLLTFQVSIIIIIVITIIIITIILFKVGNLHS